MNDLERYDAWFQEDGPSALVIREHLVPVEGPDGVLFPPTFAGGGEFKGGYNIDAFPDGTNVCLVDSVGSQANRIEPLFSSPPYAGLVPQIVITAGTRRVSLLEAGHRAGDAIVRCSALQDELRKAFQAVLHGDCHPLALIAPTSILFGAWDSRDTQAKLPRLIASTVRAFDVRELRRSAQFVPAVDYLAEGLLDEPPDKQTRDKYAERGFVHVPATGTHGGVIATGGVRRDATFHVAVLRTLATADPNRRTALQRYILGLALTAITHPPCGYLRQGCHLVLDANKPPEFKLVFADGRRDDAALTHEHAFAYAKATAAAFGLNVDRAFGDQPDREVPFDVSRAKDDVTGDRKETTRKAGRAGAKAKK